MLAFHDMGGKSFTTLLNSQSKYLLVIFYADVEAKGAACQEKYLDVNYKPQMSVILPGCDSWVYTPLLISNYGDLLYFLDSSSCMV